MKHWIRIYPKPANFDTVTADMLFNQFNQFTLCGYNEIRLKAHCTVHTTFYVFLLITEQLNVVKTQPNDIKCRTILNFFAKIKAHQFQERSISISIRLKIRLELWNNCDRGEANLEFGMVKWLLSTFSSEADEITIWIQIVHILHKSW